MGWSKEQYEAWKKDYAAKRGERRKAASQRLINVANMKKTHDWATTFTNTSGTMYASSGILVATHCKKCGITNECFKIAPCACPEEKE